MMLLIEIYPKYIKKLNFQLCYSLKLNGFIIYYIDPMYY